MFTVCNNNNTNPSYRDPGVKESGEVNCRNKSSTGNERGPH